MIGIHIRAKRVVELLRSLHDEMRFMQMCQRTLAGIRPEGLNTSCDLARGQEGTSFILIQTKE